MGVNYWLFVLGTLALTGFIGYGTYATARLLRTWQPERNLLLLPGENVVRIGLILLCLGLGWLSELSDAQLGWQASHPISQLVVGILSGALLAFFFYATTRWIVRRTGQRFYSSILIEYIVPDSLGELLLVLMALVPVVLLEELLFRSLLLGGFAPILPEMVLLLGLGAVFGALHSPQGLWGMIGAGLAGIFFGLLFLWQQSLLAPLVAHYVANALQIGWAMALDEV